MSNIKKFRIKTFKNKSILKLDKISLKYGRNSILDGLSLSLNQGQILGLLGPNGVGKTTIFNLITGLITPDFGSISINSEKVNKYPIFQRTLKFKIGFVTIFFFRILCNIQLLEGPNQTLLLDL